MRSWIENNSSVLAVTRYFAGHLLFIWVFYIVVTALFKGVSETFHWVFAYPLEVLLLPAGILLFVVLLFITVFGIPSLLFAWFQEKIENAENSGMAELALAFLFCAWLAYLFGTGLFLHVAPLLFHTPSLS